MEHTKHLAADFVASRVQLVPSELACGYRMGYLDDKTVVALAEDALVQGLSKSPVVEQLALLLSNELDRVPDLITDIETASTSMSGHDASRVWLFLVLAQAYEQRKESEDPMAVIEAVYADFGYPEEIAGFVPFLPAPEGQPSGHAATERRWRDYLVSRSTEYSKRSNGSES